MEKKELLKLLVCPACRQKLAAVQEGEAAGFACENCRTVYPIRNDIPILLIEEAIPIQDWPKKSP